MEYLENTDEENTDENVEEFEREIQEEEYYDTLSMRENLDYF